MFTIDDCGAEEVIVENFWEDCLTDTMFESEDEDDEVNEIEGDETDITVDGIEGDETDIKLKEEEKEEKEELEEELEDEDEVEKG